MFNFLKKKIGGFVDSLRKKEEEAEQEDLKAEEDKIDIPKENKEAATLPEAEAIEDIANEKAADTEPAEALEESETGSEEEGQENAEELPEENTGEESGDKKTAEQDAKYITSGGFPKDVEEGLADAEEEVDREDTIEEEKDIRIREQDIEENDIKVKEKNEYTASRQAVFKQEPEREVSDEKGQRRGFGSRIFGGISSKRISEREFESLFEDLEMALLENNTAFDAVERIKEELKKDVKEERFKRFGVATAVREMLRDAIGKVLEEPEDFYQKVQSKKPYTIMFLGVNGSGKTTSIAKLAYSLKERGIIPVIAASDTFRAAAIHQLEEHADKIGVRMIKHDYGADPAAVAFDAVKHAQSGKADVVLIDTAGRLHSNENLLKELQKIKRVANPDMTIFVGESIAGNDVLEQAQVFNDKIKIDGIILTKTDVDEKGGAALSVSYITKAPIYFFANGQGYDDLVPFSKDLIMKELGL